MDMALALYIVEDTFRFFVLRSTVSSFQNYPAKSSDARLEGGCFFLVCICLSATRKIALGLLATHTQSEWTKLENKFLETECVSFAAFSGAETFFLFSHLQGERSEEFDVIKSKCRAHGFWFRGNIYIYKQKIICECVILCIHTVICSHT